MGSTKNKSDIVGSCLTIAPKFARSYFEKKNTY